VKLNNDQNKGVVFNINDIAAIMAHELGHFKHRDALHLFFYSIFYILGIPFIFYLIDHFPLRDIFALKKDDINPAPLLILSFLLLHIEFNQVILNYFKRRAELAADNFAIQQGYGIADALLKLSVGCAKNYYPHPLWLFFRDDHPSLLERFNNAKESG